ncbi:Lin1244/Lin1753 domain-containing protein [Hymenobacter lapidiphilus]|uniref:DUF4373 domain-containing protein n=1 Tax=Hymenobacter lapidiphilus TaxID=2608003 RepID=A0A7Y7U7J5_9BACT|nr:Lin1244/Lin1753 domain-containing protein [Hymenobacter lapidiphilus]NVO33492.1 DUF4373 domain-containing protein [Hymenobacter lapidiphilus]
MNPWIQHEATARSNARILELRAECGWAGYGMWWAIVENLRMAPGYRLSNTKLGGLALDLAMPATDVRKLVDTLLEIGLIETEEEGAFFYSTSVRRRLESLDAKRAALAEAGKRGAAKRWAPNAEATVDAEAVPVAELKPPHAEPDSHPIGEANSPPIAFRVEKSREELKREEQASKQGAQGKASPVDKPAKVVEYRYDDAPIFLAANFYAYLDEIGFPKVDKARYLLQIQTVGRDKGIEVSDDKWRAFIRTFLNNDLKAGRLIDSAPAGGYSGAKPVQSFNGPAPTPTHTGYSIAAKLQDQKTNLYL